MIVIIILDPFQRQHSAVIHQRCLQAPVIDPVYPGVDQHPVFGFSLENGQTGKRVFHPLQPEVLFRDAYAEAVAAQAPVNAALVQILVAAQPFRREFQRRVPEGVAVQVVNHLQVRDFRGDNQIGFSGILRQQLFGALIQIIPVIQACQLIVPGVEQLPLRHMPLFCQVVDIEIEAVCLVPQTGQRLLYQFNIAFFVIAAYGELLFPFGRFGLQGSEFSFQAGLRLLRFAFAQVQKLFSGPVQPDAVLAFIKEKHGIFLIGNHPGEHPVQQAHRPVVQGKIEVQ